jgi:HSP20 family protein
MADGARKKGARGGNAPVVGFLGGLADLIEKLGELAESGGELRRGGEVGDDRFKAVYGVRLKVGSGDHEVDVEPFGNVKLDRKSMRPVVTEVREPMTDIIEEPDHVLVVAEMPGVTADDVSISVDHDLMTLEAAHGKSKYRKEILLPKPVSKKNIAVACNNGIVEIKCRLK